MEQSVNHIPGKVCMSVETIPAEIFAEPEFEKVWENLTNCLQITRDIFEEDLGENESFHFVVGHDDREEELSLGIQLTYVAPLHAGFPDTTANTIIVDTKNYQFHDDLDYGLIISVKGVKEAGSKQWSEISLEFLDSFFQKYEQHFPTPA